MTDNLTPVGLELQLFDGVRLQGGGDALRGKATQRRRLAILAYLALAPKRTATRERVTGLLWPDQAPEAARKNLNEAVYNIRRELGAEIIETRGEDLALSLAVGCDVDRFEQAIADGRLADAVAVYTGPLFGTWSVGDAPDFEQWAEAARDRYARRFADVLLSAASAAAARGEWSATAAMYARLRQDDPESVTAVEGEARALARGGEPLRGVRVLDEFADRWQREFGSAPPAAVALARAAIASGAESPATPSLLLGQAPVPAATPDSAPQPVPSLAVGAPVAPPTARFGRRWAMVAAVLTVAALGVFALSRSGKGESRVSPAPSVATRVAILAAPLARQDSALAYLRDALTSGVIQQLNTNAIAVTSASERRAVEEGRLSLDSLIALRRVGTLVELLFALRDGQLQSTVRVLDAASREVVSSRAFVSPPPQALALESDMVRFVADVLRRRLRQDIVLRDTAEGQRDDYARKLLISAVRQREDGETVGRSQSPLDREAAEALLKEADAQLVRALVQEPQWATLWVERARLIAARTRIAPARIHGPLFDSALAFVDSALAHAPENAAAHEVRGMLYRQAALAPTGQGQDSLNLEVAVRDLKRATAIEPQRADAWLALSLAQMQRGEPAAATAAARRAIENDAFVHDGEVAYFALFAAALTANDADEAMQWCRQGRIVYPDDVRFYHCELSVMRHRPARPDDESRAWQLVAMTDSLLQRPNAPKLDPYFAVYARAVATGITARAGNRVRARSELATIERMIRQDRDTQGVMERDFQLDAAWIHLQLGDRVRAEAALRRAVKEKPNVRRQLLALSYLRDLLPAVMGSSAPAQPATR